METIKKIMLYAAAGAAMAAGALGCGDPTRQEERIAQPSALEYKAKQEERSELGKQIDRTFQALGEAMELEREYRKGAYIDEGAIRKEVDKEMGTFEEWLERRSK